MRILAAALLIGVIAGLRTFTAPAAVSWAARLGRLPLLGTPLAFMGYAATPYIFTLLALGEIIFVDKNPKSPSRKAPPAFATRVISGGFSGACIGLSAHNVWLGLLLGLIGAVIGTLGGAALRSKLAAAFGKDLPAAITEDVITIVGAFLIMTCLV